MMRLSLLLDIPQILCLGFLLGRFGSIIVRGVQNRLRNYSKQEEVKNHEYKYVQCLLRRSAGVSVQKSWFQRNIYEWDPYFKFPNRIIATTVLSFYGLYLTVTVVQIMCWWVTSNIYKLEEMLKSFLNETSFLKHLNYFTYSWYISSACAALTCVIHITEVLVCYRKHIKSLRVGEKKFLPKTYKLDPAHGVVGLLKYPGYQIAFSVWGYVILHIVMFVLGLMFVYLVISPIRENGFLDWLKSFAMTMSNFFILLALAGLQRMLGHFFFLQDKTSPTDEGKPLALNNRKAFHNFNYFFFFINMIFGFMSCLWRVLKSTCVGLMLLSRINRTIMPVGFETMDKKHNPNPLTLILIVSQHFFNSVMITVLEKYGLTILINETVLNKQCEFSSNNFLLLCLLPAVLILLLLSFVERRKNLHAFEKRFPFLRGRFGIVVPLDFTSCLENRWSYAFAFGATAPLIFGLFFGFINPFPYKLPRYLKVFVYLISSLEVGIVSKPFFACLSTPHKMLGGVLGLLYTLAWFIVQLWDLVWCKKASTLNEEDLFVFSLQYEW
ncbi:stimulated by retinoic acid 6 protein, partial [Clarias magur]